MDAIFARLLPASQKLLTTWLRLPRDGGAPSRAAFDPCDIAGILPVISLIERIGPREWRVRLAGTELERRWGRNLSGLSYSEVLSPQAVDMTHREFDAICSQPCGSWSRRRLDLRSGRRLQTETLRLPLRGKSGETDLILSCSSEVGDGDLRDFDERHEIVTVFEQEFFDIGAGVPEIQMPAGGLTAAVTTPAPTPCC